MTESPIKKYTVSPYVKLALMGQWVVTCWNGEVYETWELHFPIYTRWLPRWFKNILTRRVGRYSSRDVGPRHEKEKDRYVVKGGILDLSLENERRIATNKKLFPKVIIQVGNQWRKIK